MSDHFTYPDTIVAHAEGWDLFDCSGSANGPLQIQRLDEEGILDDDTDAWMIVARRSAVEDGPHRRALLDLMHYNPVEFDLIANWSMHNLPSS